jgi:uncharacterized OB-fold protein
VNPGVTVSRCPDCDWQGFPERLWCPGCGSDRVSAARVNEGRIVMVTVLRRAVGGLPAPVTIGLVALAGGGELVARLGPSADVGASVRLETDRGAPVARALAQERK